MTAPLLRALVLIATAFCANAVIPDMAQANRCGELIELTGHNKTKLPYSLMGPERASVVLVLLPGGSGFADLDKAGCAQNLTGNFLVRTRELFYNSDIATALVDAPANYRGVDGLGGFRISPLHADDLGKIIAELRRRTKLPVWLVGTSRGSISAVNAASRLTGEQVPDGLVITSPVTAGRVGGRKEWVAQTVFSVNLAAIKIPVLVVAHANDTCIRTPPALAPTILARINSARKQAVIVKGTSSLRSQAGVEVCQGKSPHGFIGQEQEVTAGIIRFVSGGNY